jgi:hypothetical protein
LVALHYSLNGLSSAISQRKVKASVKYSGWVSAWLDCALALQFLRNVYRINGSIEVLQSPITLSGETVLPGFVLNLATIFKTD